MDKDAVHVKKKNSHSWMKTKVKTLVNLKQQLNKHIASAKNKFKTPTHSSVAGNKTDGSTA